MHTLPLQRCNNGATVPSFVPQKGDFREFVGSVGALPHCLPVGVGVDVGGCSLIKPTANSRELGTNCLFYTLVKLTVSLVILANIYIHTCTYVCV